MEILANNKDKAIEELLGLDEGTLKREADGRFTATIWGGTKADITSTKYHDDDYIIITGVEIEDEEYELCEMCGELHLASECREEVEMGWLCDACIRGIKSRGEELMFID